MFYSTPFLWSASLTQKLSITSSSRINMKIFMITEKINLNWNKGFTLKTPKAALISFVLLLFQDPSLQSYPMTM